MKRTYKGYETDRYYINRHMDRNIFSYKLSVSYWEAFDKETGERVCTGCQLKDIKDDFKKRGIEL